MLNEQDKAAHAAARVIKEYCAGRDCAGRGCGNCIIEKFCDDIRAARKFPMNAELPDDGEPEARRGRIW